MITTFQKIKQLQFLYFLSNIFISFLFFFILSHNSLKAEGPKLVVGINQIVEHPALDRTRQGILDELESRPPKRGSLSPILVESAQGQLVIASQIAQKFKGQQADVIVAIGTTAAQATQKVIRGSQTRMVFASVTDPLEAGLLKNLESPEGRLTGVSNFVPLESQLDFMKEVLPDLKKLGVLYNPGEANSVSLLKRLKQVGKEAGLEIVEATALKSSDVTQATRALQPKVQAIFITNDNTALSAFEAIAKITGETKTPLFVSDTDMVSRGALAALGPDQYALGRQVGDMVRRLLDGEAVQEIPVEYPSQVNIVLNQKVADKIGYTFMDKHLKEAKTVIGG